MKTVLYNFFVNFFKKHIILLYFIIGIISFGIWGYMLWIGYTGFWLVFFDKVYSILLTGGVIASIVNSDQFLKIFQDQLRGIISFNEHLKVRKDLDQIWERVTSALSKQRFHGIHRKLFENIKKYYLPIDHDYYYQNYDVNLHIDFDVDDPDYIIVTETNETTIVSDDKEKICYRFSGSIDCVSENNESTTYELCEFKYNGKTIDVSKHLTKSYENDKLKVSFMMECEGRTKYSIIRSEKKRYNLRKNCHRQQIAIWVYDNFKMTITHPLNMSIIAIGAGVLNEWKNETKTHKNYKTFTAQYSGLIYKKQGLILYLCKN